jgi:hypothetical protein
MLSDSLLFAITSSVVGVYSLLLISIVMQAPIQSATQSIFAVQLERYEMSDVFVKSDPIFYNNLKWLLYSGIRVEKGPDAGAIYSWKDLNRPSYPFIYSEAIGYATTLFSWAYAELKEPAALQAAKESSQWVLKNVCNYRLMTKTIP